MVEQPGHFTFQTQSMLRSLLESAGLHPRKRWGQHFLIDRNLMGKLIEAAELRQSDCVLEVGCGTGSLTGMLAQTAGRVIGVEIDPSLATIAGEQLSGMEPVQIHCIDALKNKSTLSPVVEAAVWEGCRRTRGELKLVANLPYDIATSLIVNLLLGPLPFARFCFTVQAEVADRFLADHGDSAYGPIGILCKLLTQRMRITRLPPQAFWPPPKVSSAMVRLDVKRADELEISDPARFADFVRSFFRHRRKTMSRISKMVQQDQAILPAMEEMDLSPLARPEMLTVEQWVSLFGSAG